MSRIGMIGLIVVAGMVVAAPTGTEAQSTPAQAPEVVLVNALNFSRAETDMAIAPGWNYVLRLYRPRKEILDGTWKAPELVPAR